MKSIQAFLKITAILLFITSCDKKKEEFSLNEPSMPYQELKELALTKADTNAYHEMSIAYMDSPNDDRFLYTALLMANKHNYHLAYEDVYYVLTDYYHKKESTELEDLDEKTRTMALDYLKAGAEKGNKECKRILGRLYIEGQYVEKNEELGNRLKQEAEE
ncbi:hypothetical protein [Empedobacter brevis]|uniref:hypothetical protein n=1 Tax=Empedobacter brevis TaxID=247 RepID=UPI00289DB2C1|nr:hypothetical protein [Empedobacter brevis]